MQLVAIIGAGASVAEAASHRPVHTAEHPPLDTNFFSKVAELGPLPLRATLSTFAASAGIPDPFARPEPRMEQFFGDIYFELVDSDGVAREAALDAYRALLRLYTRVLAGTTNWLHDRRLGAIGRLMRDVVQLEHLERLTLVTFNHDLVLENALVQLPYRRRWCVDQGYGPIALRPVPTTRRGLRLPRHSSECDHNIQIELLKLHGSLNWQVATRSHDPSYRDLFPPTEAVPSIECITDRVVSVALERKIGRRRWRLWPQIVPPIYQKMDIVSARFGMLWRYASAALEQADRVLMVGYSMPSTDVHAEKLIGRAIRRNLSLKTLDVVNPDHSIASRVAGIGGLERVNWYRDLSLYRPG